MEQDTHRRGPSMAPQKAWDKIRTSGRHRPGGERGDRNEIHYATTLPDDAAGGIISGLRQGAEIVIFLDTLSWLQSGMRLYLTVNHVALAPDDVHINFWLVVYHVASRTVVWYNNKRANIRLSGDLLASCLSSEPLEFWPQEPWALDKQGSRASVGRKVITDLVEGRKTSNSSSASSSSAPPVRLSAGSSHDDAMTALSAFADALKSTSKSSWKPSLPQRNKLEELNNQLALELSKQPCSASAVDSLTDQIRELQEIADCFPNTSVQSSPD